MADEMPGTPVTGLQLFKTFNFTKTNLGASEAPLLVDLNSRFANIVSRNASVVEERNRLNDQLNQQEENHKGKLVKIQNLSS